MSDSKAIRNAFAQNDGIFRLAPAWVPRSFCIPGRRIKLHPDDYYALGSVRGGLDERWIGSATPADNGPLTGLNEGISHVVTEDGQLLPLTGVVAELGADLIGSRLWDQYKCWPVYTKFFDNLGPLPHHVHHRDEHAALVGQRGKPECYYFPPQLNNYGGRFPFTFFGLEPGTTRAQLRKALEDFTKGDNHITDLSRAYRLRPGTGWDVPPGVLHAPGSLCTYEPQAASDVYAMYQSIVDEQVVSESLLWKDTPADKVGDFDYLIEVLDWELNVDPEFVKHRFMAPLDARPEAEMVEAGALDRWICYRSAAVSAKETTILPGRTVTLTDSDAYGIICVQGHGTIAGRKIESPALIRFGQLTNDEFFVAEGAARNGVVFVNESDTDPMVLLRHFGPATADWKQMFA